MAIISVISRKGGVGKTTIAGNLAGQFLLAGKTVIALDLDSQETLSEWATLGNGALSLIVKMVNEDNPEKLKLIVTEQASGVEHLIIDCPPGFWNNALLASLLSDIVLIPAGPSPFDIGPAKQTVELCKEAQLQRGSKNPIPLLIPSKVVISTLLSRSLPSSLESIGVEVLPSIGQRIVIATAALSGKTIAEFARTSKAGEEFYNLYKALEACLEG